jgi:hypothetical protein
VVLGVDDVIAALGPRVPAAAESPKLIRQAYIYIAVAGEEPDPEEVARVDELRAQFEPFFHASIEGRMAIVTTLR